MSLVHIRKLLSSNISPYIDDQNTKHAAVLVVIYGDEPKIIMTQKPNTLQQHAGEISFPGGKFVQDDEDLLNTAIRETKEEISLEVMRNQVIGQLRPVHTRNSDFTIIPFVAILQDISDLKPNSEVAEILHIPLLPLLSGLKIDDDANHRALFEAYVATYQNKIIWGASARILKQMADIFRKNNLLQS
ncbi:MAG TPA: CoA pyrophosphatase [Candidatus Nitrosotenuis sp.]